MAIFVGFLHPGSLSPIGAVAYTQLTPKGIRDSGYALGLHLSCCYDVCDGICETSLIYDLTDLRS